VGERGQKKAFSRIPFLPAEERVIDSLARWMGVLGRFQVLAGGLLVLTVIGVALAYGMTEAFEERAQANAVDTAPPLITLGEVPIEALVNIGLAVSVLGALVIWGGVLLIDSSEDLEHVVHAPERDPQYLEDALRRLRRFYRIEALLTLIVLGLVLAWAIPGWT
jgi:hypothetical protein